MEPLRASIGSSQRELPARDGVVAVVAKRGKLLVAEPFLGNGRGIALDRSARVKVGDLVLVGRPTKGRGHAKVLTRIGRPDVAADVLEALMLDQGLRRSFDPAVEREASKRRDVGPAGDGRTDLVDLPTFTIDPATARDFDDAISARVLDDGATRIWVHIADVSAYVRPGTLVDREAARRATSVYLPGRVEPMLPESLSNDACSLVPHLQRAAVTVEMDFDGARVVRTAFHRSTIRSDARLSYDEVDRVFAGEAGAEEQALSRVAAPLAAARAVAATLHERRLATDALELETSEPEFTFDGAGNVRGVRGSEQTEAHRVIEHLMIAANEQVARHLDLRGVPTLYRVHARPSGERAKRLVEQLASLGVPTPPVPEMSSPPTPAEATEIVAECSQAVAAHARSTGQGRTGLTYLVLRALAQAVYAPENKGHAGLGLEHYCHFTSPIRRYPDLVAHRALLSTLGGSEPAPRASDMESEGVHASLKEREAMGLERLADRVARCFLLEATLGRGGGKPPEFDGEVTGVIGAGAFVRFGDATVGDGHEGLLPVRRLRGDWWDLNEEGTKLLGDKGGGSIAIGDRIRVIVERIEPARGRVDVLPADAGSIGGSLREPPGGENRGRSATGRRSPERSRSRRRA